MVLSEINRAMLNHLFDLPGSKTHYLQLSKSEKFFMNFFYNWTSVTDAYKTIEYSVFFLSHYPSGKFQIPKADYIKYHYEVIFQTMFILRERLRKLYKETYYSTSIYNDELAKELDAHIKKAFQPILDSIRNPMVHEFQEYNDEDLRQISVLELLSKMPGEQPNPYKYQLNKIRTKVRKEKEANAKQIFVFVTKVIEDYQNETLNLFFDKNNKFKIPKEIKSTSLRA